MEHMGMLMLCLLVTSLFFVDFSSSGHLVKLTSEPLSQGAVFLMPGDPQVATMGDFKQLFTSSDLFTHSQWIGFVGKI